MINSIQGLPVLSSDPSAPLATTALAPSSAESPASPPPLEVAQSPAVIMALSMGALDGISNGASNGPIALRAGAGTAAQGTPATPSPDAINQIATATETAMANSGAFYGMISGMGGPFYVAATMALPQGQAFLQMFKTESQPPPIWSTTG
ncbi:hypothetical protein [Acidiphilium sp.]|uniref:hypothetical protein n=1 Tax=Acidiphilium sp. TaxID=527 RepID=UPI003CFD3C06